MTAFKPTRFLRLRLFLLSILTLTILLWFSLTWSAFLRHNNAHSLSRSVWWHRVEDTFHSSSDDEPRIRYYEWNITRADISPDGVKRPMILVNDRFPGPSIQASVGDTIVVRVNNHISTNGSVLFTKWDRMARSRFSTRVEEYYPVGMDERISIHWHGLSMRGSPDQDGAPGFTSASIPPGSTKTYRFQVQKEDVGTHWWHSHTGMTRSDGLWGTLIVRDPIARVEEKHLGSYSSSRNAPLIKRDHEQTITVGDHYFAPGIDQISWFMSRHSLGFEPTPDNILINGMGRFNCNRLLDPTQHECSQLLRDRYPIIQLEEEKVHRLRIINVGSVGYQTFSIDQHLLTVIEADGVIIEPYVTERLSIAPGQRYSVLVSTFARGSGGSGGKFWLRTEMDHQCFNMPNPHLDYQAKAIVQYTSSSPSVTTSILRSTLPPTQSWPRKKGENPCHDEPPHSIRPIRTTTLGPRDVPEFDSTLGDTRIGITVTMPKLDRNGLVPVSWINRTQFRLPPKSLLDSFSSNPSHSNVNQTIINPNITHPITLDLVINNHDEFHLHGHKFHLIAISESSVGFGSYIPTAPNPNAIWFNNPLLRFNTKKRIRNLALENR